MRGRGKQQRLPAGDGVRIQVVIEWRRGYAGAPPRHGLPDLGGGLMSIRQPPVGWPHGPRRAHSAPSANRPCGE